MTATATAVAAPAPATHITLAYGSWGKDALVMLEPEVALVVATIYTKYAPALIQAFYPPSSLSAMVDKAFAAAESGIAGASLTFDAQSSIIADTLRFAIAEVPAIEKALAGLEPALVTELKVLGVLPK